MSVGVGSGVPRPEHPRPQLVRARWLNLNGEWEFESDRGDSGYERGLLSRPLSGRILVPFCPESAASGVGDEDFHEAVWYRRTVVVPASWGGTDAWLHLGAVDHDATVWANGIEIARHRGGFTPFSAPLSRAGVGPGDTVEIVVRARDPRRGPQARGKQATSYAPSGCFYPRTTGIWQTVWLEAVPPVHVRRLHVTPDLAGGALDVSIPLSANLAGGQVVVEVTRAAGLGDAAAGVGDAAASPDGGADDTVIAAAATRSDLDLAPRMRVTLPDSEIRPWSPADPHLYGLLVRLVDREGAVVDELTSYAGLRSISVHGNEIRLNGERLFQRLVLDQGYWPDSLMTAPSDAALELDIRLGLAAGFDGARLHQKVFEERYLYHADRLGYLVWGEFGDWGAKMRDGHGEIQSPTASFVTQWVEVLQRDVNHPSIIGWCPLNETEQDLTDDITVLDDVTRAMFLATKAIDPSRPVIDASGWSHRVVETDVYDAHCYEQRPWRFRVLMEGLAAGEPLADLPGKDWSVAYAGQPYLMSEYGGIWWAPGGPGASGEDRESSWGYGQRVRDLREFYSRYEGLTTVLLGCPDLAGYCYTQLTDTFQEQNGLYTMERSPKMDMTRIRAVQQRPAAYEQRPPAT
nr:sugar-binding domain-containing protein [Arsenicicoccus sp. oral taxon 190]